MKTFYLLKGEEYKLGKRLSELKVMYKKAKEEEKAPLREKEKGTHPFVNQSTKLFH